LLEEYENLNKRHIEISGKILIVNGLKQPE